MAAIKRLLCCCYGGGDIMAFKRAGRPLAAAAALGKKQESKKGEWKDHEKDPDAGDLHSKPDVVTSHKENGNVTDGENLGKIPVEVKAEVNATDTDCESLPDIDDGQTPEIESDTVSVENRVSEVVEDEVVEQKIAKEESAIIPSNDTRDDTDSASMKPSEEIRINLTTPANPPSREIVMTGLTLSVDRSNSAVEETSSPTTPDDAFGHPRFKKKGGKGGRSLFQIKRNSGHADGDPSSPIGNPGSLDKVLLVQTPAKKTEDSSDEEK